MAFSLIVAGMLAAAPAPPAKEPRFPPLGKCSDDRGVDRCEAEQQRRVRELFDVKPIEAHRDAGDEVRRTFYVDGYGRDVVAIEFIRPRGGDPLLRVSVPRNKGEARIAPMTAPVGHAAWEDLIRRSAHFDQPLASQAASAGEDGDMVLCLHGWVFTVEAAEPAEGPGPAKVRARTEGACDDGLVEAFAVEMERSALPLLPACARLDPDFHRNEATLLSACSLLEGDRLAAADAMNRVDLLRRVQDDGHSIQMAGLFAHEAKIAWDGQAQGETSAPLFWAKQMGERTDLYYSRVIGESPGRARLVGQLARWIDSGDGETRLELADAELIWSRESGDMAIESAKVGAFVRQPEGE